MSKKRPSMRTAEAAKRFAQGNFELPSPQEIENKMSEVGGWSYLQLAAWGIPMPPKRAGGN